MVSRSAPDRTYTSIYNIKSWSVVSRTFEGRACNPKRSRRIHRSKRRLVEVGRRSIKNGRDGDGLDSYQNIDVLGQAGLGMCLDDALDRRSRVELRCPGHESTIDQRRKRLGKKVHGESSSGTRVVGTSRRQERSIEGPNGAYLVSGAARVGRNERHSGLRDTR